MSLNKVVLVGQVAWDPELKRTKGDRALLSFGVITEEFLRHKQVKGDSSQVCHRAVAFGQLANNSYEFLKRGSLVYLQGRLQPNTWKSEDGTSRYSTEIVCSEVSLLQPSASNDTR